MNLLHRAVGFVRRMIGGFLAGMMMASVAPADTSIWEDQRLLAQNDSPASAPADVDFDAFGDEFNVASEDDSGNAQAICVADPLEPWNRAMFVFNDKSYFWVLKPVARGYKAVVPTVCREGVRNFFNNLLTPVRLANCILQGKGMAALGECGRFICNSTLGVLGFGNPARKYPDLNPDEEDLGQTLGRYGIGHGIYIVWPLLGPSSLRDTVGLGGDYFLTPTSYVEPTLARVGVNVGDKINQTSLRLGDYEAFKAAAFEPYAAARDAYLQYRKIKVEK